MNQSNNTSVDLFRRVCPESQSHHFENTLWMRFFQRVLKDLHSLIESGLRLCVILRGLPGSGKSSVARVMVSQFNSVTVVSADDYFMKDDVYSFDGSKLKEAHKQCQEQFIASKNQIIVVDNTNVSPHEYKFYIDTGYKQGRLIILVEPDAARDLEELQVRYNKALDYQVKDISWDLIVKRHQSMKPLLKWRYTGYFFNCTSVLDALPHWKGTSQWPLHITVHFNEPVSHLIETHTATLTFDAFVENDKGDRLLLCDKASNEYLMTQHPRVHMEHPEHYFHITLSSSGSAHQAFLNYLNNPLEFRVFPVEITVDGMWYATY
jgi:predicted kinase